ncbi:MAG: hypothetical protein ACO20H_09070 [Bacteriovoracaceae bacterium]
MEEKINYNETFGISKQWLDELFPFHFVIDEWGGVIGFGPLLSKAIKDIEIDEGVDNLFEYDLLDGEEGEVDITVENLKEKLRAKLRLVGKMVPFKLIGEVRYFDEANTFLFLGRPYFTQINQLKRYGINLEDLPLSDPSRKYLELLEGNS